MNLFFLHGMGGNAHDWDRVAAELPGRSLTIPHGRSFGDTAEEIAHSLRLLDEPFVLCGYSMGGRIAIRVATLLAGASRLRGLALLSAGLGYPGEEERRGRRELDARWAERAGGDPILFWHDWYRQELFSSFRALPDAVRATWMKDRFSLDIGHLQSQFRRLGPGNHEYLLPELEALPRSGISVLYIAGERDKKYCQFARQIELPTEILEGGHVLPLENPGAVAQSLGRFLEHLKKGTKDGKEL